MKQRKQIIMLVWFLLSNAILCQINLDSLEKRLQGSEGGNRFDLLIQLSNEYRLLDYEKGLHYGYEALNLVESDNSKKIQALLAVARNLERKGELEKAIEYAGQALELNKLANDKFGTGRNLLTIGSFYAAKSNLDSAFYYYTKAHEYFSELKNDEWISNTLLNISAAHFDRGELKKALDYSLQAYDLKKKGKQGSKQHLASLITNIAVIYLNLKEYEKSIEFNIEAQKLFEEMNSIDGVANIELNSALAYVELKKYDKAERAYRNAIKLYSSIKYNPGLRDSYLYYGVFNRKINSLNNSINYLNLSLKLSEELKDSLILPKIYFEKAAVYELLNDYKKAFESMKKWGETYNYTMEKLNSKRLFEAEARFGSKQKELENIALKKENDIHKETLRANRIMSIAGSIVLALIIAISIILYRHDRKIKSALDLVEKKNEEIEKKNDALQQMIDTKDKFFSILAHNLKNPFTAIMGFTGMLENEYNLFDENERKEMIKRISASSKNVYHMMEDLLNWARAQKDSIKPELVPLSLDILINDSIKPYISQANNKGVQIINGSKEHIIFRGDRFMLETVIGNFADNAIKFSNPGGKVVIAGEERENEVEISIADSGVGMSPEKIGRLFKIEEKISTEGTMNEKGTGFGLLISKEFIEKHEGKIIVESREGEGTVFRVILPVHQRESSALTG